MRVVILILLVLGLASQVSCEVGQSSHERRHVYDKNHIREDLHHRLPEEDLDKLDLDSQEAMEFHYFKLHDYNKDNKLDGLELGAAMTHYHQEEPEGETKRQKVDISDEEFESLINEILKDDDLNNDGYVDYYEFVKAQRRAMSEEPSV